MQQQPHIIEHCDLTTATVSEWHRDGAAGVDAAQLIERGLHPE